MSTKLVAIQGTGSGNLETVIKLYIAWGKNFIILLDLDKEGLKQKKRYEDLFGPILNEKIYALSDIDSSWTGFELEEVFKDSDRELIQRSKYPLTEKFNKQHFNRAVQEYALSDKVDITLSKETTDNITKYIKFIDSKMKKHKK